MNDPWEKLIRHKDYYLKFNNIEILVKDHVFTPDPKITYSTSQILNNLQNLKNKTVLDIGCGTGIIGISSLKLQAKKVVFSDNNKKALDNTKFNLKLNKFNKRFELINSDLFENIFEKFDYIYVNLPILDDAWNLKTETLAIRFLNQCKDYVNKSGKVFFTWASFSDIKPILKNLDMLKYDYKVHKDKKLGFIWYLIEVSF